MGDILPVEMGLSAQDIFGANAPGTDPLECVAVHWRFRIQVFEWADESEIYIEYQGSTANGFDLWRVENSLHRLWFVLKWGHGIS